jgi:hypothetical protein
VQEEQEQWKGESKLKFNGENEKTEADVAKRDKPYPIVRFDLYEVRILVA